MQNDKLAPSSADPERTSRDQSARPGIVVAHGHALAVRVDRRHLTIEDGSGRQRRTRKYHRTDKLTRLVLIGRSGYITLDALRFLHDTGTTFVHLDTDGEVIATSVNTTADLAGLRRSQALAATGPVGLEIARHVLGLKVQGQQQILAQLPALEPTFEAELAVSLAAIETADDLPSILVGEARAAAAYWQAWAKLPVRFASRDENTVPEHWKVFEQRRSRLTQGPRTATNPANAILNYLYALLEAETILACHTVGLDPGLGIFHTDRRDRASLALDLMEAIRPTLDAYLLALLTQRTLAAREFVETREGGCRITPRLGEQLADTCETWAREIAPIVEWAANTLAKHAGSKVPARSPLTQARRRAAIDERMPGRGQRRTGAGFAALPNTCRECGTPLADNRRHYCDEHRRERFDNSAAAGRARAAVVLAQLRSEQRDPAHGGNAARLRGRKNAAHQAAVRAWQGGQPDANEFRASILPGLRHVSIRELVAATGLSDHYCSLIRLGKKVPHARHWTTLSVLSRDAHTGG